MKKIVNYVLLLVLGLVLFPSIVGADTKKIGGITYSRVNIDYSLSNNDNYHIEGYLSPTDFIIYFSDTYEYRYFKNGAYRLEAPTLAERMQTKKNLMNSNLYVFYKYNNEYEIMKYDYTEKKDSSGQCYANNTDLTAQEGVTYYTIEYTFESQDLVVASPVLEFDEDDAFRYCVKAECMDNSTGVKLTETQITKLNDVIDSIEAQSEETYADKFNVALNYFPFLAGDKYINIFETRYTNADIDYNEELYDPSEFEHVYSYYDLEGNKIEKLEGVTYMEYLGKSNLIVAIDDTVLYIFDTDFNILFTDENIYHEEYGILEYYIYDIDANKFLIDINNGNAIMITRYVVLEGEDQTYTGKDLILRFNGEKSLFDKVYVNDTLLSNENYVVSEGSTIITLKDSYLKTLKNASYTLKATYTDGGEASTTFVVNNVAPNPNTSDAIVSTLIIGSISILAILGLSVTTLKKRVN